MTTLRDLLVRSLVCCAVIAPLPASVLSRASAQEVEWRYDYGKARQEAVEKGRALVIEFKTESCFFCTKMDTNTFRDLGIVAQMNQQCIPLKIDANQHPDLAGRLNITKYPTLILASPDGRVLDSLEGFVEAQVLKGVLEKVIAATGDADWMLRAYADALRAREAGDFSKAIGLLKPILEEGKGRPVHARATQQVRELEDLAKARALQLTQPPPLKSVEPPPAVAVTPPPPVPAKGPLFPPAVTQPAPGIQPEVQAVVAMTEISRWVKGALTNRKGVHFVAGLSNRNDTIEHSRAREAQDILIQAKEDYRKQQYLACLDRCEMLIGNYPDLSQSAEAQQMASEIKKNPEWTKLACDQLGDRLSVLYLNLAETWLVKGEPQQAIFYLERVIQTAPNSRHAERAQVRLTQLQGQPVSTKVQDFKKSGDTSQ